MEKAAGLKQDNNELIFNLSGFTKTESNVGEAPSKT